MPFRRTPTRRKKIAGKDFSRFKVGQTKTGVDLRPRISTDTRFVDYYSGTRPVRESIREAGDPGVTPVSWYFDGTKVIRENAPKAWPKAQRYGGRANRPACRADGLTEADSPLKQAASAALSRKPGRFRAVASERPQPQVYNVAMEEAQHDSLVEATSRLMSNAKAKAMANPAMSYATPAAFNPDDSHLRDIGTSTSTQLLQSDTPGQSQDWMSRMHAHNQRVTDRAAQQWADSLVLTRPD
jgi:hypothetical protein